MPPSMGSEPQSPDGQAMRIEWLPGLWLEAPATPKALRTTTQQKGTGAWPRAASAWQPKRMVALSSDCLPMRNPGQSSRCTSGRWKVLARSMKRTSLRLASAVQAPPYTIGFSAKRATGMPLSRARPVMMDRPQRLPISKNDPSSTTEPMIRCIL